MSSVRFEITNHPSKMGIAAIAAYGVAWSVCRSVSFTVTFVSPAKINEPIEMPFGGLTRMGSRNHIFERVEIPQRKGHFWGVSVIRNHCNSVQQRLNAYIREYINGKLVPSAVYTCSSLGNRHLQLREISAFKTDFCQFKQQNTRHSCMRRPKRFGVTLQPIAAHP